MILLVSAVVCVALGCHQPAAGPTLEGFKEALQRRHDFYKSVSLKLSGSDVTPSGVLTGDRALPDHLKKQTIPENDTRQPFSGIMDLDLVAGRFRTQEKQMVFHLSKGEFHDSPSENYYDGQEYWHFSTGDWHCYGNKELEQAFYAWTFPIFWSCGRLVTDSPQIRKGLDAHDLAQQITSSRVVNSTQLELVLVPRPGFQAKMVVDSRFDYLPITCSIEVQGKRTFEYRVTWKERNGVVVPERWSSDFILNNRLYAGYERVVEEWLPNRDLSSLSFRPSTTNGKRVYDYRGSHEVVIEPAANLSWLWAIAVVAAAIVAITVIRARKGAHT